MYRSMKQAASLKRNMPLKLQMSVSWPQPKDLRARTIPPDHGASAPETAGNLRRVIMSSRFQLDPTASFI